MQLTDSVEKLQPSATLAINELINKLRQDGQDVLHLGFGEAPFPVHPRVQQSLSENAWRKKYLPTQGIIPLREQISVFYRETFGLSYDPEQIIVGPGSKMLMYAAMASLSGSLYIPAPSWVTYQHQARFLTKEVHHIQTDVKNSYRLTPEELENALHQHSSHNDHQKMLLLNYPSNPTGQNFTPSELEALSDVARKNNVIVLADEIYALVTFDDSSHCSIAEFYPEGTLLFGGVSKDRSLGGYRFGVMLLPKEETNLMRAMISIGSETWSCVSAPVQYATIEAYKTTSEISDYVSDCTAIHNIVLNYCHGQIVEAGIRCPRPMGAFYLFPDWNKYKERLLLKGISTSTELAETLLREYRVATLPGSEFGMPPDNLCIRIAVVDYDGTNALQEYTQDKGKAKKGPSHFVRSIAPRLVEACHQLSEFTRSVSMK
ncbi:MAG: pyridoxal phosphate-dependent aminotransferase [Candidatus Thorarchaeota archaeon]